jgi:precorrin-8X/cobalt-precorrin-8 methylmutase
VEFITEPGTIEARSLEIIEGLIEGPWSPEEKAVVKRIVHTTGDPAIAGLIRFHPAAAAAGIEALRRGARILTDVNMVRVGINAGKLARFGGEAVCAINDPVVVARARESGLTRAIESFRHLAPALAGNIVAVGNAPTALVEVIRLYHEDPSRKPALIVGVPVGFVGARESKDLLLEEDVPHITIVGNRGGSTIAVAAINALLNLASV